VRLWVAGTEVAVGVADLVVVAHDGATTLDWELVCRTRDELTLERGVYELSGEVHGGRRVRGAALLVRSDGRVHVFRGGEGLDGVHEDELG
jgi:hypothetical protein